MVQVCPGLGESRHAGFMKHSVAMEAVGTASTGHNVSVLQRLCCPLSGCAAVYGAMVLFISRAEARRRAMVTREGHAPHLLCVAALLTVV